MNKQIDIIKGLLVDFDEMGFLPTTSVPDREAYAIEWRNKMTNALKRYRTELAREIFEDIDKVLNTAIWVQDLEIKTNRAVGFNSDAERFAVRKKAIEDAKDYLRIVKKKYESEGADDERM